MKVTLFVRESRAKSSISNAELPLIIRFRNGKMNIWQTTRLTVNPDWWDEKNQQLKARMAFNPQKRQAFDNEVSGIRKWVSDAFYACADPTLITHDWLEKVVMKYYKEKDKKPKETVPTIEDFGKLFDAFLVSKQRADSRRKQYLVIKRTMLRYELFKQHTGRKSFRLDVKAIDKSALEEIKAFIRDEHTYYEKYPELYERIPDKKTPPHPRGANTMCDLMKKLRAFFNWCERNGKIEKSPFRNFSIGSQTYGTPVYLTKEEMVHLLHFDFKSKVDDARQAAELEKQRDVFIFQCSIGCRVSDLLRLTRQDIVNGALEYIPAKTINENGRTVVVPLNKTAKSILEKYKTLTDGRLLPFIPAQQYNEAIRQVLRTVGINRIVTILNPLTGREEKKPICEVAASHMARRTFIGNLYKKVQDPNIVASLSGHSEGSRAFCRYREIDREIKTNVVNLLDE